MTGFRQSGLLKTFAWGAIISILLVGVAESFRLSTNRKDKTDEYPQTGRKPWHKPPFLHWDLREFPGCVVPYSVIENAVELTGESGYMKTVADSYTEVEPALIVLSEVSTTVTKAGPRRDRHNVVSWLNDSAAVKKARLSRMPGICYIWAEFPRYGGYGSGRILEADIVFNDFGYVWWGGVQILIGVRSKKLTRNSPVGLADDDELIFKSDQGAEIKIVFEDDICDAVHAKNPAWPDKVSKLTPRMIRDYIISIILANYPNDFTKKQLKGMINVYRDTDGKVQIDIRSKRRNGSGAIEVVSSPASLGFPSGNKATVHPNPINIGLHEFGHFIGLEHPNFWQKDSSVMKVDKERRKVRSLFVDDKDGCNFLYNPDLGDAPHFDDDFGDKFSTHVHDPGAGRTLNNIKLDGFLPGAMHKFGIRPRQARNYTYEWLGVDTTDDMDSECEANTVDKDKFDDGVTFSPDPPVWGESLSITMHIQTAADYENNRHGYFASRKELLYATAWLDYKNINGKWETPAELIIRDSSNQAFTTTTKVLLPLTEETIWLRARLDWGEHVESDGLDRLGLSPDLQLHEGAAQFGEVEDYPLACRPVYEWLDFDEDLCFTWTGDNTPFWVEDWYFDFILSDAGDFERFDHTGQMYLREEYPFFDGEPVEVCMFPPRQASDWWNVISTPDGKGDVIGYSLEAGGVFGPPWSFEPLSLLPAKFWRIPVVTPAEGGDTTLTVFTAVNLPVYLANNPFGFLGGYWTIGDPLDVLEVTIQDGKIPGIKGVMWATSQFVYDENAEWGFAPLNGPGALLNTLEFPAPLRIATRLGSKRLLHEFLDCNVNGISDLFDILLGEEADTNENGIPDSCEGCCITPGDANNNGTMNIADAIYIINRVFGVPPGPPPPCCEEGDANGNGSVNIADAIYIINRIFRVPTGPAPICGPAGMGC